MLGSGVEVAVHADSFREPQQVSQNRDEAFWRHASAVTPSSGERSRRQTDAARLTFSLPMVVGIVCAFISMVGAFWIATSGSRSDIRDILTKMTDRQLVDAKQAELDTERQHSIHTEIATLQQQVKSAIEQNQILEMKFDKLREQMLLGSRGKP